MDYCWQVDKSRGYVEIFQFTQGCNWLDVVEVRFYTGDEPGDGSHTQRSYKFS